MRGRKRGPSPACSSPEGGMPGIQQNHVNWYFDKKDRRGWIVSWTKAKYGNEKWPLRTNRKSYMSRKLRITLDRTGWHIRLWRTSCCLKNKSSVLAWSALTWTGQIKTFVLMSTGGLSQPDVSSCTLFCRHFSHYTLHTMSAYLTPCPYPGSANTRCDTNPFSNERHVTVIIRSEVTCMYSAKPSWPRQAACCINEATKQP